MFEFPLWFIYIFIALILRGFLSFIMKVISYNNLERTKIFFFGSILSIIILCFLIDFNELLNFKIFILGIIGGLLFYSQQITAIKTLNNISTSAMFVNTRIFSSIFILILGYLIFGESLTIFQFIGFIFGIFVFILFFDKTDKPKTKSDIKKGIYFLFLTIIIYTVINLVSKYGSTIDVKTYLFYFLFGILVFNLIEMIYKKNLFNKRDYNKNLFLCILIYGFCMVSFNYFFFKSLTMYNLAVLYKIFSFEIFIPIILSIIIYKEKITLRKIAAFILTIFSIWFFL